MLVNGKDLPLSFITENSILSLLENFQIKPGTVAIEKNGEIIPKDLWNLCDLSDSDKIEIIKFVGGG